MWQFIAIRDFKRSVAPVYRENWKIYVEVESGRNISRYMKAVRKSNYFKKLGENYAPADSYNEFDLN
jgi:hypothetical protein